MKPITEPRAIGQRAARQSSRDGSIRPILSMTGCAVPMLQVASTSPRPNSATARTINSMPSRSQSCPKLSRGTPVWESMPTVESSRPATPIASPLITESPTTARQVRPSRTSAKYSGGPNAKAKPARAGASKTRPTRPTVPAMNEPIAAMPRATPARPWRAIWCPSTAVMTPLASPGTLTSTEVSVPPYCEPA